MRLIAVVVYGDRAGGNVFSVDSSHEDSIGGFGLIARYYMIPSIFVQLHSASPIF